MQARVEGGDNTQFSLVAECDGQIVGNAGLSVEQHPRRRHVANIGMAVHDDHHGKGIGSQLLAAMIDLAENWLAVTRIELSVYTDNAAGVALYEKHGFQIEARPDTMHSERANTWMSITWRASKVKLNAMPSEPVKSPAEDRGGFYERTGVVSSSVDASGQVIS